MALSFRSRLFIALFGLLVIVLAIVLLAVNHQTQQQVQTFTIGSVARARAAFEDAEKSNRGRLEGLGYRFTGGARATALLRSALVEGVDTAFVANQLDYELAVVGEDSALLAFTNIEGHPLAGVAARRALRNVAEAVPSALLDSMIAHADTAGYGYQFVRGRLYSEFVGLMRIDNEPSGFFIVGRPIDETMAENIGQAVEGDVCFVAADECVASTATLKAHGLTEADMVQATHNATRTIRRGGQRWLVMADPLTGGTGWRVIARPLDAVLKPFEDIERLLLRVALLALALAAVSSVVLARGLARPIRGLVAATSRIAAGDYASRVPVTTGDEFGTLSAAFNDMSAGLQLKEAYRGLLDKVISPEIANEMLSSNIMLGGENREVTVVFADLRGFTSFTEDMEPQDVIHILNETMERASAVVEREGGVVDKYIGDELMAIFGAPVSHPDDVVRAVRAAAGIRDAIASLSAERLARGERGITIGIGVNTGVAVAGNMGSDRRLNYTVLGMSVNIAARLCSQAAPQEILLGDATYQLVQHCCDTAPAGMRSLRGLTQPLPTYALLDVHCDAASRNDRDGHPIVQA